MVKLVAGLFLSLALAAWPISAQAAPWWFTCEIKVTGVDANGETIIQLTDVGSSRAFTNKYFVLNPARSKEMLAIALTALTSDQPIIVFTDPSDSGFPEILNISVSK